MNFHDPAHAQVEAWRTRFDALVRERMNTPFAWGRHDCCLWAADAVRVVSGVDPAPDVRETYQTAVQAAQTLRRMGGLAAVAARAGAPIAPLYAGTADIGLVSVEGRESLAVCAGPVWLVPGNTGLAAVALAAASQAWRVAHG